MKHFVRKATLVYVAVALACAPIACKKDSATAEQGGKGGRGGRGAGGGANVSFAVDVLEAESKKIDYVVTAPGTIEAFERVQVTARVAGAVDRVAFTEGAEVKKGDLLVAIDSERFARAVNSAKAALAKAKASQADNEAMVQRREGASEKNPGLIPGEELATFRTKVLTAKADTAVADEALKLAELNMRDSSVRAPIDGIIQTRTVETGQYVNTGYVMATLLRSDPMLLRFQVEPQEAPRLKPGMIANFTMRETQREFKAKLTLITASADTTTHMVGVTGEVMPEEHRYWLRPGSFCDVSIDVGATRDAIVIPRLATRATDKGYVVYVVENDVADMRPITLGMSTKDGWVEVRSGLKPGDGIVVRGAEALSPGVKVRVNKVTSMDASAPPQEETKAGAAGSAGGGGGDAPPAGSGSAGRRRRGPGGGPPPPAGSVAAP